jgi:hypothetical protein
MAIVYRRLAATLNSSVATVRIGLRRLALGRLAAKVAGTEWR